MTPKRQARLWNQVSQRELENLWNRVGKERKKKRKRKREENERAGELLESSGSKGEKKMRELLESGSKEKEKGEDVLMDNGIRVWWTKCKRKKKEKKKKEMYG